MQIRLLQADEIEVKIKQVTAKGAFALLYKTARTDMAILDEVFTPYNWTNDYKEIKGNLYCGIGVYMVDSNEWVWRWDCGIESREDDGNEKKGEASDAFKRAGTRWGIGRELYTAPMIFLRVPTKEVQTKGKSVYVLENKYARFDVKSIEYDDKRRICGLEIVDDKGEVVFKYPNKPAKSGDSGAKAVPSSKQTSGEKKGVSLEEALATRFTFAGTEYVLANLSEEWLRNNKDKERFADIKPQMEVVLKYKMLEAMNAPQTDTPFGG